MAESSGQLAGVARLRERRVRKRRDQTLHDDMDRALHDLVRQRRAVAGCAAAWARVVPPELGGRASLEGVTRGVLSVRVPNAAARFALDRFLRGGGQRALAKECSVTLRQVRINVGA